MRLSPTLLRKRCETYACLRLLHLVTNLVTGLAEDSPKSVAAEDFGAAGRAFGQLGGEWSFSPDDLDSLARLGAMNQPLPVG